MHCSGAYRSELLEYVPGGHGNLVGEGVPTTNN